MALFKTIERTVLALTVGFFILGCQGQTQPLIANDGSFIGDEAAMAETPHDLAYEEHDHEHAHDDGLNFEEIIFPYGCSRASSTQIGVVKTGNAKVDKFVSSCVKTTGSTKWCQQLTRPNPNSKSTFSCTYGTSLPHQLIHPDESTWKNAIQAAKLVTELEAMGISVYQIYNWWRPEPYNANVGGAAGRHPFGTSVDVRFSSMRDMERAHSQLCKWRKQGRLRALGYYGSTGLHFGIGDKTANTWGKSCP